MEAVPVSGRPRPRQGQFCGGGEYDLLACLADAAASAPLSASAMQQAGAQQHRQAADARCAAACQPGPTSDSQLMIRRLASAGRISPSPPAEMDAVGAANMHAEREVRVTCNGTLGTFLLPSQTVQCHCPRCAPDGASGESFGIGAGAASGAVHQQHPHQQAPAITPTEFERHSGLLTAKKWRNSIRLVQGDGTITIGKWLEQHNILPRPKCSGPLGSPGPGGSASMAAIFGTTGFGVEGVGHPCGPLSGNDSGVNGHGIRGAGGAGACDPHGRCALPPSRYPASEYVTGDDDEYDDAGAQLAAAAAGGGDDDGLAGGQDFDGAHDDEDYDDGPYGDGGEVAVGRGGGRRGPGARGGARSGAGLKGSDRRGLTRAPARSGAGGGGGSGASRTVMARGHHRGRQAAAAAAQRAAALAAEQQHQEHLQQLLLLQSRGGLAMGMAGSSNPGAGGHRRGSGSGSQEEGAEEDEGGGGGGKGHSSSEGSPPSEETKQRGGSGGSGEGDGSGTGDGGDSRRAMVAGVEGERRVAGDAPGCTRRSSRHGPVSAKAQQQQQLQQQYAGGREGYADAAATQDRSARHAAAVKRLPPEYLTGADIGQACKRARTRASGAAGAAGAWGLSDEELAAFYETAAAGPQVRGWRFLGAAAGPAAEQVLISVAINGRTYTGVLAPQLQPPPSPPPPPPLGAATATAGLRAPLAAPSGSNAAGCGSGGMTAAATLSGRRPGGIAAGVAARAPTTSTGRTNLPSLGPTRRLGPPGGVAAPAALSLEDGELVVTGSGTGSGELTPAAGEDEPPDDGMPPDCPRCALCRRCASPALALPPPTPGAAPSPSPALAKLLVTAEGEKTDAMTMADARLPAAEETTAAAAAGEQQAAVGAAAAASLPQGSDVLTSEKRSASGSAPGTDGGAAAGSGTTGTGETCSGGGGGAAGAAAEDGSATSSGARGGGEGAQAAGAVEAVEPGKAKLEVKSEGDSADDSAAPGPAMNPGKLQPPTHPQKPAPEASRTTRQSGCGLGPLVEVRCCLGDGTGAAPAVVRVHSQCALWSPEVFVIGGAMYGVPALIKRSRAQRCAHCGRSGASLSCCSGKCSRVYHLPCAMEAGAMLAAEPYSMACPSHRGAAAPHTASSAGPAGRLPPPRLRPAPSQGASQSTAATATAAAAVAAPAATGRALSQAQQQGAQPPGQQQQQQQQVSLPLSLQQAVGRRVVLPPLATATAAATVGAGEAVAAPQPRSSRFADASGLPALMMLRAQTDGRQALENSLPPPPGTMPPPPRTADAAGAAANPAGGRADNEQLVKGKVEADTDLEVVEVGGEEAAVRSRTALDEERRGGSGAAAALADSCDGAKSAATALAFGPAAAMATAWPQGHQATVFEMRQAAAAAAVAAATDSIAVLAGVYCGGGALTLAAGTGSSQLDSVTVVSEGGGASQGPGAVGGGAPSHRKRRWESEVASGAVDVAVAAAAGDATQPQGRGRGGSLPPQLRQQPSPLPPLPPTVGAMPPMLIARGGGSSAEASSGLAECPGGGGDTLGLGLGLGLDPASGLHLSHTSAFKLLQQHPQLGAALPEGVAAMLLAHHNHHSGGGGGSGLRPGGGGGGEGSVGSPGSTATQPARGMPGGGGRPRHHHQHQHHHSSHHGSQYAAAAAVAAPAAAATAPGASASTASASIGTTFGRAGGAPGGDESPPPSNFHAPPPPHHVHGGVASLVQHMLPRAARNIEALLPSRPLLHNPYVPSSGDPSADLTLSKIAQNGSREVEAELLGGTTGRAGHSGRCAVCVIQRKGKCGTESAPKKCLRRQLVALQRATGAGGGSGLAASLGGGGSMVVSDEAEDAQYGDVDGSGTIGGAGGSAISTGGGGGGGSGSGGSAMYMDERIAAAAAEQRARERARRETWSLPLGQGSGATGKRPQAQHQPQQQYVAL